MPAAADSRAGSASAGTRTRHQERADERHGEQREKAQRRVLEEREPDAADGAEGEAERCDPAALAGPVGQHAGERVGDRADERYAADHEAGRGVAGVQRLAHDGRRPDHVGDRHRVVGEVRQGQQPGERIGERAQRRAAGGRQAAPLRGDARGEPAALCCREPAGVHGALGQVVERKGAEQHRGQALARNSHCQPARPAAPLQREEQRRRAGRRPPAPAAAR